MKKEFCNPVSYQDNKKRTNPDPYILRWCGRYYCYSTDENGINVSYSDDLVHWTYSGFALTMEGKKNFWAPAVLYRNGIFYMYFSCFDEKPQDSHGVYLHMAQSDSPLGTFEVKKQFFNKFSIDAHPVEIGDDVYLFYSVNDITGLNKHDAGTCIVVDKLIDMQTLAGNPQPVLLPSLDSEIYERDRFAPGQHWHTIEGACFYEYRNRAYVIYSANAYINTDYYLSYAVAEKKGDFLSWNWQKYPDNYTAYPWVKKTEWVEGTGHNTVTKAPNMVDDWLVYHGRNAQEPLIHGVEQRVMRIDPFFVDGYRLVTDAPSSSPQCVPELPALHLKDVECTGETVLSPEKYAFYIAELWVCPDYSSIEHRGVHYSIVLDKNENSRVELELISGLHVIKVKQIEKNIQTELSEIKLPCDFNYYVPHLYAITKIFNQVTLTVDNRFTCSFTETLSPGTVSIVPFMLPVTVKSFALTVSASVFGKNLSLLHQFYNAEIPAVVCDSGLTGNEENETKLYLTRKNIFSANFKEYIDFEPLCSRASLSVLSSTDGKTWTENCSFKGEEGNLYPAYTLRWHIPQDTQVAISGQYVRITGYSATALN